MELKFHKAVASFREADKKTDTKEHYLVEGYSQTDVEAIMYAEYEGTGKEITVSDSKIEKKYSEITEDGSGTFFEFTFETIDDKKDCHLIECESWDCAKTKLEELVPNLSKLLKQEETKYLGILRAVVTNEEETEENE